MTRHLVLVGAGHAHLPTLLSAGELTQAGHRVTLVASSPYSYYSGMGPGLLSDRYAPQEARFNVQKMAEDRGVEVVSDSVARVDADRRILTTAGGTEIAFDIASFNVGSQVPSEIVTEAGTNVFSVKPIENLIKAKRRLLEADTDPVRILVIGGGPAGFEISCGVWELLRKKKKDACVTLIAGRKLLPRLPERGRVMAARVLAERRMEVREGTFVRRIEKESAYLDTGQNLPFDIAFLAVGIQPVSLFRHSGLPTGPDGGLRVNRFLQSTVYPNVFGAGDCVFFEPGPLDRVGVYAVREGPILLHNLLAAVKGRPLRPFHPQKRYLLIFNLGSGRGLFWRNNCTWDGRNAFRLKEWLDRRFMRKYQVSGERDELDRAQPPA